VSRRFTTSKFKDISNLITRGIFKISRSLNMGSLFKTNSRFKTVRKFIRMVSLFNIISSFDSNIKNDFISNIATSMLSSAGTLFCKVQKFKTKNEENYFVIVVYCKLTSIWSVGSTKT
jgi:hypothetical protein